jgi:uridine kinase
VITVFIKNEVNETISHRVCTDWDVLLRLLQSIAPDKRVPVPAGDGEERKAERLSIVILEGEEVDWKPTDLIIQVRCEIEREY